MKKKKPGFTLIEMIMVVALTVIILGITSSMFITGNKVFSNSDVKSTLQIEGQAIQENISKIGMESIGLETIKDDEGLDSIENGEDSTEIVKATYEDLKSKLTDIDGTNEDISKNRWLSISEMKMNFYKEESNGKISIGTPVTIIKYVKNHSEKTGTLLVNGKELSTNVESIRIKPINIEGSKGTFRDANSISIDIVLSKKKGYSDVTYPISIQVKFRNNFIKQS